LSFREIKDKAKKLKMSTTRGSVPKGGQYKPILPTPKKVESRKRRISYVKDVEEVKRVGEHLFDDQDANPSVVGERCFDLIHREALK